MPADIGSIQVYMGPADLGGPDNLEAVLVDFIDSAQDRLWVAVQELEDQTVTEALTAAAARGVDVRVILERMYLGAVGQVADPFVPGGRNETNRVMLNALLRAGVAVTVDLNPATFHQKFIVRDPTGPSYRAAVLTGSTNFTPTGLHANLNHLVVVKGKRTAGVYAEEFTEMWEGTFGALRRRRDPHPAEYLASRVRVKVLFAPDHAPEMEIMKQILKATNRVKFAVFTFTDTSGIDDVMRAVAGSGVQITGVMDRMQGNQTWAATHGLLNRPNIDIHLSSNANFPGLGKLHHKLLVLDGQVIVGGSFNFTLPATNLNDENIFVIGDLEETDQDVRQRQAQLAAYAEAEIGRIVGHLATPA